MVRGSSKKKKRENLNDNYRLDKSSLIYKKSWGLFSESDQKSFNTFIINRWLSMDEEFVEVVNYFQKYAIGTLEPREVYKWYCEVLQGMNDDPPLCKKCSKMVPRNLVAMERVFKVNAKPHSKDGSWEFKKEKKRKPK